MTEVLKEQKLIRLSTLLLDSNLVVEASLVANLSKEIQKEAGVTEFISDMKDYLLSVDPEIIEYISLGMKIVGALTAATGGGALAGKILINASALADIYAAALHFKNGNYISCLLSIISAITSVPNLFLTKFYAFLFSEKFLHFTDIFTKLSGGLINADRSALIVVRFFDLFERCIPAIFDALLKLLDKIMGEIIIFSKPIATQLGILKEDVEKKLQSEITKVSRDISSLYTVVSSI